MFVLISQLQITYVLIYHIVMTHQQLHEFGLSPEETDDLDPIEYRAMAKWARARYFRANPDITAEDVPAELLELVITDRDYRSLQYVLELGCVFDERHTALAATCGDARGLRWLLSVGVWCKGTPECWGPAKQAVRYWHDMWNWAGLGFYACALAAGKGNLACLQVLQDYMCPWDAVTTYEAARGGHLDCLQFAVQHGCECTQEAMDIAVALKKPECVAYMETLGLRSPTRRLRSGRVC